MTPRPIQCNADLPGGNKCPEYAIVTNVQYVYDRLPAIGTHDRYDLKEIHYHAVCPKCGERKLVETLNDN